MIYKLSWHTPQSAATSMRSIPSVALALLSLLCVAWCTSMSYAQPRPWPDRVGDSAIQRWPVGRSIPSNAPGIWNYETGTLLEGMDTLWYDTANDAYFQYIKQSIDQMLAPDGSIPTDHLEDRKRDHTLDIFLLGRQLLLLYRVTRQTKYYNAAVLLRDQLAGQPRNAYGGFWHTGDLPDQMWLDGLYVAEPFYAEYASQFHEQKDFADITRQFVLIEEHTRDQRTGLYYHAWDPSKKQPWANKVTGQSPNFWARGTGWYMMALVDTLPYYSQDDPNRAKLLGMLNRVAASLVRYQDKQTGLWYQVLDKPNAKGNYFESSAACMFTYALAKGVRLGYLPTRYSENATRAWEGILKRFVRVEADGSVDITGTVKGVGLIGAGRYGSYSYYVSTPVISNDPKGVGAFLLAGSEMRTASTVASGRGEKAVLDAWFNSQQQSNAAGQMEYFHYKWNDFSDNGYSLFGHIFRKYGVETDTLYSAPTITNLKGAQFYIIVSPDILAKNPHPHYVQPEDAAQVAQWVKGGGVLLMMDNDPANADIEHLDGLSDRFGIHFNPVLSHHVVGSDHAMGRIPVTGDGPLFHTRHTLYMKDTCTISVRSPAVSLLRDRGDILMASAKYGKGTVFAVVDPWVYNEYTDGRNLSSEYDNFAGAEELVRWLLQQLPSNAPLAAKNRSQSIASSQR